MQKLVVSFTHLYGGAGIKGTVFTEKKGKTVAPSSAGYKQRR